MSSDGKTNAESNRAQALARSLVQEASETDVDVLTIMLEYEGGTWVVAVKRVGGRLVQGVGNFN
jgi:hypothetical protein